MSKAAVRWLMWRAVPLVVLASAACRPAPTVAVGAALSSSFVNATRLAIEDAQVDGGLPGLDSLLLTETTNSAAPAIGMAEQFVAIPGLVAVVGHSNSSASLAASQIYNDAEVVQIAPTSTAPRYSEAGPFSFRLAPPDPEQGRLLSQAVNELHPNAARVALLFVNDDYGRGLRGAVLATLDQSRHRLVLDVPHLDFEVSHLTTQLGLRRDDDVASVVAQRPDIIFWLGRYATFRHYLPELRRQLPDAQFLGGDALSPGYALAAEAPEWAGVRYADFLDPESTPELRRFRERFTTRFGTPARTAEVLSYDAMRLILAAVAGGARSGPEVREWLLRLGRDLPPYQGLSGPIQFNADGDVERPFVLVTIPGQP